MRHRLSFPLAVLILSSVASRAVEFSYQPRNPTFNDSILIELRNCPSGGVLHWGVNARGNHWEQAIREYRPAGSVEDGVATRTPLKGTNGLFSVRLGPFNHPSQEVASVDFAIQWADGSWDTGDGNDYHVPLSRARIGFAPERPSVNSSIVVTVHRSRPGGQLRWGVNAEQRAWVRPIREYWPAGSVPSDDGLAVDTPLPPPDAQGDSVITLGPFRLAMQDVFSLHAAAHWGDDWDTDFGRNYNIVVEPDSGGTDPRVALISPTNGQETSGDLPVVVQVKDAEAATLWLDGQPLVTLLGDDSRFTIAACDLPAGEHRLLARSEGRLSVGFSARRFWSVPSFSESNAPPGTAQGATVNEDGTVTFALFAPGKHFVSLVGDFNGWDPAADRMNRSNDGTWWLRRSLPNGAHEYQYFIDGTNRLADPYAHDVTWKNEKGEESAAPKDAKAVLEIGKPPFAWSDADFQKPPIDHLVIYEFHIDDFCPGQGFTGVIARLDYIKELGVTAIEPLPFHEFPGAWSWGYNPAFHLAPETTYGTPDELKRLIDEAHRRGLAVIMDTVLNHMEWNAPLFQLYGTAYAANPYFWDFKGENWGFPDCDQKSPAFKRYVADLLRYWIEDYHIDGFRYDATRWVGWSGYNDWGASWFAYAAKQAGSNTVQIAEHLPSDPELESRTEMDSGWHDFFRWQVRDMIRNAKLDPDAFGKIMDARRVGFGSPFDRVAYIESHDEERFLRDLQQAGFSEEEALRRDTAALAILMTTPGVVMVYAGEEFGEATPKIVWMNPLHWSNLNHPPFQKLDRDFKTLTHLRTTNPALRTDAFAVQAGATPTDVAVYERSATNACVVVAVNFGRQDQPVPVSLPLAGNWTDVLNPEQPPVEGGKSVLVPLRAGEARVFVSAVR